MEKIWLQHYTGDLTPEIDTSPYASLAELLRSCFDDFADLPAYTNMGATLSYRQTDELSARLAGFLINDLQLSPGDRVAIMSPNLLQYPVALFAALRAGLVVVNVNPLYTPRELRHQLRDSGARAIVVLSNFAATLEEILAETAVEHVVITELGDLLPAPKRWLVNLVVKHVKKLVPRYRLRGVAFRQALQSAPLASDADVSADDLAFLQYTGGTTGVAKGAMLTHGNMVANITQTLTCLRPHLVDGKEIIITPLPLYHIFALTCNCFAFARCGGLNVLITNPRDIPAFVTELKKWPFTYVTGVNTLYNALLNNEQFRRLDFTALKFAVSGGMALQAAVADRWQALTGGVILEGYGLSETSPVVCVNPCDLHKHNGSIGVPVPSTDISVRDDSGRELGLGEEGELWIKGPQVMRGYWEREQATAEVLTPEGWFNSGDIARLDEDGFVRIVDRKKDMIIVSGFNVYPNEVEGVLAMHEGVLEVGCVGVSDAKTGEAIKAFIVPKPGVTLSAEELEAHCREYLTPYKVPRLYEFRDELPKTNVGKVLRRELRETEDG